MSQKNILDTNLIIRFLVNDDPQKVSHVEQLLKDQKNTNVLLDTVIAEIVWVLSSYYSLKKEETIAKMRALIYVETIDCNQVLISKTLTVWEAHNISYIDAYLAAAAELGQLTLLTYDDKLFSLPNIQVNEP